MRRKLINFILFCLAFYLAIFLLGFIACIIFGTIDYFSLN